MWKIFYWSNWFTWVKNSECAQKFFILLFYFHLIGISILGTFLKIVSFEYCLKSKIFQCIKVHSINDHYVSFKLISISKTNFYKTSMFKISFVIFFLRKPSDLAKRILYYSISHVLVNSSFSYFSTLDFCQQIAIFVHFPCLTAWKVPDFNSLLTYKDKIDCTRKMKNQE